MSNLKRFTCASKREGQVLATLRYAKTETSIKKSVAKITIVLLVKKLSLYLMTTIAFFKVEF